MSASEGSVTLHPMRGSLYDFLYEYYFGNYASNSRITLAEETEDETYLAIPLLFQTGLRIGECLGLTYDDIRREEGYIYVHQSLMVDDELNPDGTWKTRKFAIQDSLKQNADPREVVVTEECFSIVDKVRKMQEEKGKVSELLFTVKTESDLQLKLRRICRRLGIPMRSPHKIRKTYVSQLVHNHVDFDFIRSQVGHQDIQTTLNSYTYSTMRNTEQAAQLNMILPKSPIFRNNGEQK